MISAGALTREEWEQLRYPIELRQLSNEEGGGWLASIPQLGEAAFRAPGETVEEALAILEDLRLGMFDHVVTSGQPVPMPDEERDHMPSGRWLQRVPPTLHLQLQEGARREGVSFNQFCTLCLERGLSLASVEVAASSALHRMLLGLVSKQGISHTLYQGTYLQPTIDGGTVAYIDFRNPQAEAEARCAPFADLSVWQWRHSSSPVLHGTDPDPTNEPIRLPAPKRGVRANA